MKRVRRVSSRARTRVSSPHPAFTVQRSSPEEARETILRLTEAHLDPDQSRTVITPVRGVPDHQSAAFRLSDAARGRFAHRLATLRTPEGREALILHWRRARGCGSSTEAADLTGLGKVSARKLLAALADAHQLEGSRTERIGRGYFYTPVTPDS